MEADDRNGALELIQAEAEASDEYAAIVSDILEELRERFNSVAVADSKRTLPADRDRGDSTPAIERNSLLHSGTSQAS